MTATIYNDRMRGESLRGFTAQGMKGLAQRAREWSMWAVAESHA